jgi:hypothetical protein
LLSGAKRLLSDAKRLLGDAKRLLSDAKRLLSDAKRLLSDAKRLLGDAKRLLGATLAARPRSAQPQRNLQMLVEDSPPVKHKTYSKAPAQPNHYAMDSRNPMMEGDRKEVRAPCSTCTVLQHVSSWAQDTGTGAAACACACESEPSELTPTSECMSSAPADVRTPEAVSSGRPPLTTRFFS